MPELAEVEHSRRTWNPGLLYRIRDVLTKRQTSRIYRDVDCDRLAEALKGQQILSSEARGKQMLFTVSGGSWLGIHLGMRGELRYEPEPFEPKKHDYLVLTLENAAALVFEDQRLFGRIRFHHGTTPPAWWAMLPPSLLSPEFTASAMGAFLKRRAGSPLKGLLLMQECFPGIGNWMADEILWRARLDPATRSRDLTPGQRASLYRAVRWVCRTAVEVMDEDWQYPASWLFTHRWEKGGACPRCHTALDRAPIAGRTTAWCPACQPVQTTAGSAVQSAKATLLPIQSLRRKPADPVG